MPEVECVVASGQPNINGAAICPVRTLECLSFGEVQTGVSSQIR